VNFTRINNTVTIEVTIFIEFSQVFWIDFIFKRDSSIIIGIIVVQYISGDRLDVITIPGSFTFSDIEWTITIDMTVVWAIFVSPVVFTHNNASVDFTSIKRSIVVEITIFIEFRHVFFINIIFKIDRTIHVGVIVVDNFDGDIGNVFTIPSTFAFFNNFNKWTFTIERWISFWAVFESPFVFTHDDTFVDFTLTK